MRTIDLNADLGEGAGHDLSLFPLITSANIGCGFHAGDAATTRLALEQAHAHGVAIGAHPGYADPVHFGRRSQQLSPRELGTLLF
ncbi:MAG: LamB/YcsF family protein, partial [Gemmataceae bacterium]